MREYFPIISMSQPRFPHPNIRALPSGKRPETKARGRKLPKNIQRKMDEKVEERRIGDRRKEDEEFFGQFPVKIVKRPKP